MSIISMDFMEFIVGPLLSVTLAMEDGRKFMTMERGLQNKWGPAPAD